APVLVDDQPGAGAPGALELPAARALFAEEPLAAAEQHRSDEQVQRVDEPRLEQRPAELRAAVHLDLARVRLLQLLDLGREVAAERRHRAPARAGAAGHHVLW